jgi:hypothetical protein
LVFRYSILFPNQIEADYLLSWRTISPAKSPTIRLVTLLVDLDIIACSIHDFGGILFLASVLEFLTEETTCTNEMSKETTPENICQKRPPRSGGTPGQATRGTCRLGRCRQGPAANAHAGMLPFHAGMSRWQRAASVIAGTLGSPTVSLHAMIDRQLKINH